MRVVIYLDDDQLELKYYDEIGNLEKGLTKAGHTIVKLDYSSLQRAHVSFVNGPEFAADAYILTPGVMMSKDKFLQHCGLKRDKIHNKPVILYDFDENFTTISQELLQWCENNDVPLGKTRHWWTSVTSVKEIVNLLK